MFSKKIHHLSYWSKKTVKWSFIGIISAIVQLSLYYFIFYGGDYFVREHPAKVGTGTFRFEDFGYLLDGEVYLNKLYPKGSEIKDLILNLEAAGARCKERKDMGRGIERIDCTYMNAFFSKNIGCNSLVIILIKENKLEEIVFYSHHM